MFGACGLLRVDSLFAGRCWLYDAWCLVFGVCCALCVVCNRALWIVCCVWIAGVVVSLCSLLRCVMCVVYCVLRVVCCLSFCRCGLLFGDYCFGVCCVLFVVCYLLVAAFFVCCVMLAVCCVCCVLGGVRCALLGVCCLVFRA